MPEDRSVTPALSRRNVISAAAWSVPVVALTVATPAHAASAATIDASGVVLTFTGPEWSSEFALSGQLIFSPPPPAAIVATMTLTWQGTGANAAASGLYVYAGNDAGQPTGIGGWSYLSGAPDDQLYQTVALQALVVGGASSLPTVSRYDGDPSKPIMYGAETPDAGTAFWDGVVTIRFSAPGYGDALMSMPYTQVV